MKGVQKQGHSPQAVSGLLFRLGVPAHFKGCVYLRESVAYVLGTPGAQMTKEIYPHVGRIYHTSAASVERAIRGAVEAAWQHGNYGLQQQLSLDGAKKPTNARFVAAVAEYIRQGGAL